MSDDSDYEKSELAAIVRSKNSDGSFHYKYEEIRHWIPMLIIAGGTAGDDWDDASDARFREVLDKVRADDGESGEVTWERVHRYYGRHPVNRELEGELRALLARQR